LVLLNKIFFNKTAKETVTTFSLIPGIHKNAMYADPIFVIHLKFRIGPAIKKNHPQPLVINHAIQKHKAFRQSFRKAQIRLKNALICVFEFS